MLIEQWNSFTFFDTNEKKKLPLRPETDALQGNTKTSDAVKKNFRLSCYLST